METDIREENKAMNNGKIGMAFAAKLINNMLHGTKNKNYVVTKYDGFVYNYAINSKADVKFSCFYNKGAHLKTAEDDSSVSYSSQNIQEALETEENTTSLSVTIPIMVAGFEDNVIGVCDLSRRSKLTNPAIRAMNEFFPCSESLIDLIYIDSAYVFVGNNDNSALEIYNSRFKCLATIKPPQLVLSMSPIKDTNTFITTNQDSVTVWMISSNELKSSPKDALKIQTQIKVHSQYDSWIRSAIVFENRVFVIFENSIQVYNLEFQNLITSAEKLHNRPITVSFYHSFYRYVILGFKDGSIKIYNNAFIMIHHFTGHSKAVTSITNYPFGGYVVSSSLDGTLKLWNLTDFSEIYSLNIQKPVIAMDRISNEKFYTRTEKSLLFWEFNHFHKSKILQMDFCKYSNMKSRIFVRCEDSNIYLISPYDGSMLSAVLPIFETKNIKECHYSIKTNRAYLLLQSKFICVMSLENNPGIIIDYWNNVSANHENILCLAVFDSYNKLPDSLMSLVFGGTKLGQIIAFNMNGDISIRYQVSQIPITYINASNESSTLHVLTKESIIYVLSIENSKQFISVKHRIRLDNVPVCVYSKGNQLLIAYKDGVSQISTSTANKVSTQVKGDHSDTITNASFRKKSLLVASSSNDGCVKIWSSSGMLVRELRFRVPIQSVCFINEQCDLLICYQNRIEIALGKSYLPPYIVKDLPVSKIRSAEEPMPLYSYADIMKQVQQIKKTKKFSDCWLADIIKNFRQLEIVAENLSISLFGSSNTANNYQNIQIGQLIDASGEGETINFSNSDISKFQSILSQMPFEEEHYQRLKMILKRIMDDAKMKNIARAETEYFADDMLSVSAALFKQAYTSREAVNAFPADEPSVLSKVENEDDFHHDLYTVDEPLAIEKEKDLDLYVENYLTFIRRLNVQLKKFNDVEYVPLPPDGALPNSTIKRTIYDWLISHGLYPYNYESFQGDFGATQKSQGKDNSARMFQSADYRIKLARLLASVKPFQDQGGGAVAENSILPQSRKGRVRSDVLSLRARENLRQKVLEVKFKMATETIDLPNQAEDPKENLPQYYRKALEQNWIKKEEIFMDGKDMHSQMKIDPTTDALVPFLIQSFQQGDSLTKNEVINFTMYVQNEYGFRDLDPFLKEIVEFESKTVTDLFDSSELKTRRSILQFIHDFGRNHLDSLYCLLAHFGAKTKELRDISAAILSEWGIRDVNSHYLVEPMENVHNEMIAFEFKKKLFDSEKNKRIPTVSELSEEAIRNILKFNADFQASEKKGKSVASFRSSNSSIINPKLSVELVDSSGNDKYLPPFGLEVIESRNPSMVESDIPASLIERSRTSFLEPNPADASNLKGFRSPDESPNLEVKPKRELSFATEVSNRSLSVSNINASAVSKEYTRSNSALFEQSRATSAISSKRGSTTFEKSKRGSGSMPNSRNTSNSFESIKNDKLSKNGSSVFTEVDIDGAKTPKETDTSNDLLSEVNNYASEVSLSRNSDFQSEKMLNDEDLESTDLLASANEIATTESRLSIARRQSYKKTSSFAKKFKLKKMSKSKSLLKAPKPKELTAGLVIDEINAYIEYKLILERRAEEEKQRLLKEEEERQRAEEERLAQEKLRLDKEAAQKTIADMLEKEEQARREEERKRRMAELEAERQRIAKEKREQRALEKARKKEEARLQKQQKLIDQQKAERDKKAKKIARSSSIMNSRSPSSDLLQQSKIAVEDLKIIESINSRLERMKEIGINNAEAFNFQRRRQVLPMDQVDLSTSLFKDDKPTPNPFETVYEAPESLLPGLYEQEIGKARKSMSAAETWMPPKTQERRTVHTAQASPTKTRKGKEKNVTFLHSDDEDNDFANRIIHYSSRRRLFIQKLSVPKDPIDSEVELYRFYSKVSITDVPKAIKEEEEKEAEGKTSSNKPTQNKPNTPELPAVVEKQPPKENPAKKEEDTLLPNIGSKNTLLHPNLSKSIQMLEEHYKDLAEPKPEGDSLKGSKRSLGSADVLSSKRFLGSTILVDEHATENQHRESKLKSFASTEMFVDMLKEGRNKLLMDQQSEEPPKKYDSQTFIDEFKKFDIFYTMLKDSAELKLDHSNENVTEKQVGAIDSQMQSQPILNQETNEQRNISNSSSKDSVIQIPEVSNEGSPKEIKSRINASNEKLSKAKPRSAANSTSIPKLNINKGSQSIRNLKAIRKSHLSLVKSAEASNDETPEDTNESKSQEIESDAKEKPEETKEVNIDQANIDQANTEQANMEQANIEQANIDPAKVDQAQIAESNTPEQKHEGLESVSELSKHVLADSVGSLLSPRVNKSVTFSDSQDINVKKTTKSKTMLDRIAPLKSSLSKNKSQGSYELISSDINGKEFLGSSSNILNLQPRQEVSATTSTEEDNFDSKANKTSTLPNSESQTF